MKKIGIVGSGTMGNGIAHICAQSDHETLLLDINKKQLDKAITIINNNLDRQVKKNIISSNGKINIIRK